MIKRIFNILFITLLLLVLSSCNQDGGIDFFGSIWPAVVTAIVALGALFKGAQWYQWVQLAKEWGDVLAKRKIMDSDGVRTDAEKIQLADEFLEAWDKTAGQLVKQKVQKKIKKA